MSSFTTLRSAAIRIVIVVHLVLVPAAAIGEDGTTLRLLHVNDLHGWLFPVAVDEAGRPAGGFVSLAAAVGRLRTDATLFVAAGDLMAGTNVSNLFHGRPVVAALNAMGLEATAVGNHEFDFGPGPLADRIDEASFPFLAANIAGPGAGHFTESIILRTGGLQVGLFGLTTMETPTVTHPRNVAGLTFTEPAGAARRIVAGMAGKADLIVCLSHLGMGGDIRLAGEVPGIDVIVGGHSHTRLAEPLQVGGTIIVQAFERGTSLGVLDLTVRDGDVAGFAGRLVTVDGSHGTDKKVSAIVEKFGRMADRILAGVVGTAPVRLEGGREMVRTGETNLGSLLGDVVREAAGADIAIVNGGSIRASIPAGPVTLAHLYNAFPFDSHVLSFNLTGREVRQALETGLSRLEERGGGFPHVAGLSYRFDPARPAGDRLVHVAVGGAPLKEGKSYVVATNDFLAAGGDGYGVFAGKTPVFADEGTFVREAVARYWRRHGDLPAVEPGRIVIGE